MVADAIGISPRYINTLLKEEDTSLMRYIWQCRLENCRKDMLVPVHIGHRVTDIAFRWGFKGLSHFNRLFKKQFGFSPKDYREQNK